MKTCSQCQAENNDEARFCMSCGAALSGDLPAKAAEPVAPPPPPPPQPSAPRKPQPDPLGLLGLAFVLVIVGVVFAVNPDVFTQISNWIHDMGTRGVLFRPPARLIDSAVLFWALAGVSSFGMAFLRMSVQRIWIRALADTLSGVGQIVFAALLGLYGARLMTSSEVIAVEAVAVGILLFVYVAVGLVYGFGRRVPAPGALSPTPKP